MDRQPKSITGKSSPAGKTSPTGKSSPEENPNFGELIALLNEIKEQAKYEKRLTGLESDIKNFVKETDIHKIVSSKIEKYDEIQEKIDSKGINWTSVIQAVITAVITAIIMGVIFAIKG